MIDYPNQLNQEQLRVVMEGSGPVLVIAGAGSGKTRTLTYRVAWLVESDVPLERILLATFTNKAARAMLSRVTMLIDRDLGGMWGGTFHHIAHLILRSQSHLLGYDRNFSIMDGEDSTQLINACVSAQGIHTKGNRFPRGDVLRDIMSLSLNMKISLEEVVEHRYPYFRLCLEDMLRVEKNYTARKKSLNVMDFDDLLLNCKKILYEFPHVLDKYSERFSHILVDEYQDTNMIQAAILDLLAHRHRNIMVVGDDAQSIYSFRGAHFANIMDFPVRYPECKILKLETNYRSTPEILHFANMSIVNNENQYHKTLTPVRGKGIRPILVPVQNATLQAHFVAQRILEMIYEGIPLNEIAVLYRAHYHSMEVQMELTRRGIPFEVRSGMRFFEQAHVKDVVAYMRIITNPRDEVAWKRVLGLYGKIGKVTADKVWKFISGEADPLSAVFSEGFYRSGTRATWPGLLNLRNTIQKCMSDHPGPDVLMIIGTVLENGYEDYLYARYADAASRIEDLEQLAQYSKRFHSLDDFLSELALMTNMTEASETDIRHDAEDRIILSSIHQAKGLEWSVVIMIWCSEGMMPLARALKDPDGEEEERRLFYVAATRAKDQLYLCYPLVDHTRTMGNMMLSPSRFITEIAPLSHERETCPYEQWIVSEEYRS